MKLNKNISKEFPSIFSGYVFFSIEKHHLLNEKMFYNVLSAKKKKKKNSKKQFRVNIDGNISHKALGCEWCNGF